MASFQAATLVLSLQHPRKINESLTFNDWFEMHFGPTMKGLVSDLTNEV